MSSSEAEASYILSRSNRWFPINPFSAKYPICVATDANTIQESLEAYGCFCFVHLTISSLMWC
eukprot:c36890_g1_i1 orf=1-186(-)